MNKILMVLMVLTVSYAGIAAAANSIEITPVKFEEVDAGMAYNIEKVPVENPESMTGARIAIVAAHGFEEIEALYPIDYFLSRGAEVEIIAPDWIKERVMAVKFLKPSVWIPVTKNISEAVATDYCAVIIPGGAWNPIIMRTDQQIISFIQAAHKANKLIAAICHGPQVLISASLVKGKMVTGVGDIRIDLNNAGGEVVNDQAVVVDGNILTSRDPNDMAEFSKGIEAYLKKNLAFCRSQEKDSDAGITASSSMQQSGSWTSVCEVCKGTGRLFGGPGNYPYNCHHCNGTGKVHSHKPPVSTDH